MVDESEESPRKGLERPWVVIGAGRLGRALCVTAERLGVSVRATWNRSRERARETSRLVDPETVTWGALPEAVDSVEWDETVVWLTVVDDVVESVGSSLAGVAANADVVLHTSGSLGVEVFEAADWEAEIGSLHPLLAVTDPRAAAGRFGDVVWSVEGGEGVTVFARSFTAALGAKLVELPAGSRPLYHASAVAASNLVVALVDAALEMAEGTGLCRSETREMLLPLVASSLQNLEEESTADALSGPVARGDERTVARHLEALAGEADDLEEIYRVLTERARTLVDDD